MSLRAYKKKRHFDRTPEPRGKLLKKSAVRKGLRYVIQKHAASRLHYDFRLELDGALKSWAVPKGPSLDPGQKRLAVAVEDHPLEYGKFEGTIPAGEYGGGTVMLWDEGTWEPLGDPKKGYKQGKLHFTLHGKKLHGNWVLVRKGSVKAAANEKNWFLFKQQDDDSSESEDILVAEPKSAVSGRSMEEIADSGSQNGQSRNVKAATGASKKATARASKTEKKEVHKLLDQLELQQRPRPAKIEPQLATLVSTTPQGAPWIHEIKYDGYRIIARIENGEARLITRNQQDWTARFASVAQAAAALPVENAILDGELVVLGDDGISRFQLLQSAYKEKRTQGLVYYVFDLLYLDGYDLRELPLSGRKRILAKVVTKTDTGAVRFAESLSEDGSKVFQEACRLGLEGIVSKRIDRPYRKGRSLEWVKSKCHKQEEFVIGGFTTPAGSRQGFGALLLGYYNREKELLYAGRVGTGFSDELLGDLHKQLVKLARKDSPFTNLGGRTGKSRGVKWIDPKLIAQVEFSEWTEDGRLRHPAFLGLREDKKPGEIVRDEVASLADVPAVDEAADGADGGRLRGKDTKARPASQLKAKSLGPAPSPRPSHRGGLGLTVSAAAEFAGVKLTHPDKLLYEGDGITKRELATYYESIEEWILPHVIDRPLALKRCPDGMDHTCFFQKHAATGVSAALRRISIREKSKTDEYLVIDDLAGLISLVQMDILEIHVWGSHAESVETPDRLVFDLDPDPELPWAEVIKAAKRTRERLADLKLKSFVKTTGSKGLHVVVPIKPNVVWPQVKKVCQAIAAQMAADEPKLFVATMSKAARTGKVFIDYLRNERDATSVAAYSTRARPGATVSVPLDWDELSPRLKSNAFTIRTVPGRLKKLRRDPWKDIDKSRTDLRAVLRALEIE
jgi:bifunctional non-homologous end joining protein LigD